METKEALAYAGLGAAAALGVFAFQAYARDSSGRRTAAGTAAALLVGSVLLLRS